MEKALGAPLQPAPGSMQRRRPARPSKDSQPGTCLGIAALPGGRVKFSSRGPPPCSCTIGHAQQERLLDAHGDAHP
eukprot:4263891-Pyramimonas_sp.AAC.1